MDAFLRIALPDGGELRLDPAPREIQVARALEFQRNWSAAANFYLGDEKLDLGSKAAPPSPAPAPAEAPKPAPAPPKPASIAPSIPAPALVSGSPPVSTSDLSAQTALIEQLFVDATRRTIEANDRMVKLQAAQMEAELTRAHQFQDFVAKMVSNLAEERLASFNMRKSEGSYTEKRAALDLSREIALIQAQRPSPFAVLLQLAAGFASNFARNAAINFSALNSERKEKQ